jgi:TonB family protein
VRSRVVRSFLAASLLWAASPASVLAAPPSKQVCGIVVSIPCHPTDPAVLTLLIQPGIAVEVEAKTDADAAALRSAAGGLFLQQACVMGRQTAKQDRERAGRVVMDGTAGISANGPGPADWSPTDLHTQCEADLVPGRPKTHKVAADFHEALQNGIQGKVIFQIIVAADGTVENIRLVKSLDAYYGADRKAADFIRGTTFEPGTKAGVPVRFTMLFVFQVSMGQGPP